MNDLSTILRWIIIGILIMIGLSVLGIIADIAVAVLGFGIKLLALVLIAVIIVKVVDRLLG
ncbi:hypothetical protein CRI94_08495 [Longibacter salinarum]|uniref:Uncharacterized protein n=1 Tax=Longibacter salinarum TaxID=1850348 RepID=A0A2A8CXH9_9BACT|nr:hypothetical protein [Longibacter salinarum]PEN13356.1 hypothetical protein CRI94_08495 [Longibacter salinarum]